MRSYIAALLAAVLILLLLPSAAEAQREREMVTESVTTESNRIDATFIADYHEAHGHHQWRGGLGDWGHTWSSYRHQAHQLRAYLWGIFMHRLAIFVAALQHHDLVWHWQGVADCESGGNWAINTGNGYYGGLQFLLSTWHSVGGTGYPHQNSAGEQAYRAEILRQRSGLGQWPVCGSRYR